MRLWNSGRRGDPTGLDGELHESSRLIHGAADEALLSSLGEETEPPLRAKPTGAHAHTWDKNWNPLLEGTEDLSAPVAGPVQTCLTQRLGEITSTQVDMAEYSNLCWGWPGCLHLSGSGLPLGLKTSK